MSSAKQHGCRNAARLLSESHDRPLQLGERMNLRVHLWMCTGCSRYARQLELLAEAGREWRRQAATED